MATYTIRTKEQQEVIDATKAPLASPALTGTPTAPTATVGTNTTQIATTAFVNAEIANDAPTKTGGGASGTWGIHITGNAGTATTLKTARTIGGVSFNGSADINLPGVNTAGSQNTTGDLTGNRYINGGAEKPNNAIFGAGKLRYQMLSSSNLGTGVGSWNDVLWISSYTGSDVKGSNALIMSKDSDYVGVSRSNYDASSWSVPKRLAYADGTGAFGTWGIDITGVAANANFAATAMTAENANFANSASTAMTAANANFAETAANAAVAIQLETARTINGVSFDGSADITVSDSTKAPIPTVGGVAGTIGLVQITDTNLGYRLNRDILANKGALGLGAIDLSYSSTPSTIMGATGDYSTAMGASTTASGNYSTAMGYSTNASGEGSTAMGVTTTASGSYSTAMGVTTTASGNYTTAMGYFATTRLLYGAQALSGGRYSGTAQQFLMMCLRARTTSTAAVRATANGTTASATNQFTIPDNSSSCYSIQAIAKQEGLGAIANVKAFELKGIVSRGAGVATTIVSASTTVVIGAGTLGATITVAADTTNGGLAVNCASGSAININWEIVIYSSEIIGL